jgi:hypothetical protein
MYKTQWEQQVARTRGPSKVRVPYRNELITQIDLLICEAIATESTKRAHAILDILYELHVYRGEDVDNKILEGLKHLAVMSGLSPSPLAATVAELSWQLNWHFVGPEDVPMRASDSRRVRRTVDILAVLGEFGCEFNRRRKVIVALADALENYLSMAVWYLDQNIAERVRLAYERALGACASEGKTPYKTGYNVLHASLARVLLLLEGTPHAWDAQRTRLTTLFELAREARSGSMSVVRKR